MKNRVTKHILSMLLAIVMLVGLMPTAVLAAGEIDKVELTLDVPMIGNTLDFEPTAGAGNYEITSVRWLKDWGEHGNMLCDEYHKVEPGEPYTVRICINPKEGYSFADPDDVNVTVNGSTDGVTFTHNDLYTGIVCSVAFEELGYSISFDANGGTGTMEEVTNVYPDYTLPACGFTAPEGKVFNGWTVGSASGAWYAAGSTMSVNADVILYAKWADPTGSHKITFINPAYDPNPTVEILVSEGMYTLPGIEGIFEIPSGSTFEEWEVSIDERWQYFAPGEQISVTEDLEINAIWKPIEYERISKAVFEVKLNPGVEYKHGMLAGSLSVSLGEVSGTFNEGAPKPISLASGGYGHGYWIVSDDMLLGTDALSTRGGYRLYVKFDIPEDRHVRLHPDGFSLSGDLGNITARSIVSLDGALVALFNLPAVPGTELGTENITFTLNGYEAGETITAITAGVDTPHVSLQGSGYGSRLDDKSYMIWKDYYDYGYGVYDGSSKFENSRFYYLEINYALDEGYSFPANFWDGDELIKEKFKLSGFEKAEVYQVDRNSIVFRLPQMGNTVIESVAFILNGYEEGKAAGNVTVTILDKMIFPREDLDYFFYDESVGFSPEGDMSPIPATTFENGKRYYIAMLIGATDGYDASELEKGDFTIHTPYGSCTATGYGRATAFVYNEYYYVGFELPVINNASFTTYTVSFDADGGTDTMSDVTGVFGEYTLPVCGFTAPSDKRFKAWSVDGVEKAVGEKITVTADTTVTAVWENIPITTYTVSFNSNGGSAIAAQTVVAGQKATKPADPVKNGYIFRGWTLDGSAYDFNTAVNRNITLVAVWEADNSFMDDWYWALIMLHSQRFDVTATASEGGEIAPAGVTKVQYSKNITYTITPDVGYAIKSVIVDGKDVGAVSEYTFKNVTKKHTIHAVFEKVNPYTDVKADDWFYEDVLYVTAMGLMEGTGEGKFSPEITTNRAMLVTVLWRLEGCPVVDSPVDFFDVADGLWYSDAIDWASAHGIVNGYGDSRFGPTDQITREQIIAILNRYAAYKGWTDGTALPMLAQYKYSDWAESNVIWAENHGLLDGLGVDVSDMTGKASRAELAAYLHRFMKNIVK